MRLTLIDAYEHTDKFKFQIEGYWIHVAYLTRWEMWAWQTNPSFTILPDICATILDEAFNIIHRGYYSGLHPQEFLSKLLGSTIPEER